MAGKTAKNLLKEITNKRNKHLNAIGKRSTTAPATSAAAPAPAPKPAPELPEGYRRPRNNFTPILPGVRENNNYSNNEENNNQANMPPSPTEEQIARNLGRLPISANPYFSYDGKIIKVSSRFGDRTVYQTLSDTNTWNKEQTADIPESELTQIECDPPIQHRGGRRKRIRRTVRAKTKVRPTRRLRKRT